SHAPGALQAYAALCRRTFALLPRRISAPRDRRSTNRSPGRARRFIHHRRGYTRVRGRALRHGPGGHSLRDDRHNLTCSEARLLLTSRDREYGTTERPMAPSPGPARRRPCSQRVRLLILGIAIRPPLRSRSARLL